MLAPAAGFLAEPTGNALRLNLALDRQFPVPAGQTGAHRTAPLSPTYSGAARNPIR
jgi:hypothetical protein